MIMAETKTTNPLAMKVAQGLEESRKLKKKIGRLADEVIQHLDSFGAEINTSEIDTLEKLQDYFTRRFEAVAEFFPLKFIRGKNSKNEEYLDVICQEDREAVKLLGLELQEDVIELRYQLKNPGKRTNRFFLKNLHSEKAEETDEEDMNED